MMTSVGKNLATLRDSYIQFTLPVDGGERGALALLIRDDFNVVNKIFVMWILYLKMLTQITVRGTDPCLITRER